MIIIGIVRVKSLESVTSSFENPKSSFWKDVFVLFQLYFTVTVRKAALNYAPHRMQSITADPEPYPVDVPNICWSRPIPCLMWQESLHVLDCVTRYLLDVCASHSSIDRSPTAPDIGFRNCMLVHKLYRNFWMNFGHLRTSWNSLKKISCELTSTEITLKVELTSTFSVISLNAIVSWVAQNGFFQRYCGIRFEMWDKSIWIPRFFIGTSISFCCPQFLGQHTQLSRYTTDNEILAYDELKKRFRNVFKKWTQWNSGIEFAPIASHLSKGL